MVTHPSRSLRRRRWVVALCAIVVACVAAGLYWFQPWRLWTNTVVKDALPVVADDARTSTPTGSNAIEPADTVTPSASPSSTARPDRPTAATPPPSGRTSPSAVGMSSFAATRPTAATRTTGSSSRSASTATPSLATILATGTLISHEHRTSGTARIVKLTDGRRVLTLENLRTSDGPALHVWLTDAPVIDGEDGWNLFDDGRYTDLGNLKGNIGNQVYPLPADLDLSLYSSVSVWCERFSVSFGAAELETA